METTTGFKFDCRGKLPPLLISIRCSSSTIDHNLAFSILNVGMNDVACDRLIKWSNNEWFGLNTYAFFLYSFGTNVLGVPLLNYADIFKGESDANIGKFKLSTEGLALRIVAMKKIVNIPTDPWQQLRLVLETIYQNWDSKLPKKSNLFPAITIQEMIFGNFNNNSGSGVIFSRDPIKGSSKGIYGEYIYEQAGKLISEGMELANSIQMLQFYHPDIYEILSAFVMLLEIESRDMHRTEFVVQDGKYYIIGTRIAARSPLANISMLCSMVHDKLITSSDAILRIDATKLAPLLTANPAVTELIEKFGYGTAVSAGLVSGILSFSIDDVLLSNERQKVIKVFTDMSTHSCGDLSKYCGIISVYGGCGALVAMSAQMLCIPAIVGVRKSGIFMDEKQTLLTNSDGVRMGAGAVVTLDGSTGCIYFDEVPGIPLYSSDFNRSLRQWAAEIKKMNIFTYISPLSSHQLTLSQEVDGGICRLADLIRCDKVMDSMRLLLMAVSVHDKKRFSELLAEAISAQIFPLFVLMINKPLFVILPAVSIWSELQMNADQMAAFAVRNGFTQDEMKYRFCSKGLFFYGDNHKASVSCCHERHFCKACRECLSNVLVVSSFAKGASDALMLLKTRITALGNTLHIMISDCFGDDDMDKISAAIDIIALETPTLTFEVGLQISTPRSCLCIDKLAERYGISSLLFDTDRLTESAYGIWKNERIVAPETKYLSQIVSHGLHSLDPFEVIDQVGVGSLIDSAISTFRSYSSFGTVAIEGDHCLNSQSIRYFCEENVDAIVISDISDFDLVRIVCAQHSLTRKGRG